MRVMANNDATKHKDIIQMPAYEVFTTLSYMKLYNHEQKRIIDAQRTKHI